MPESAGQRDLLKSIPAALAYTLRTEPPASSDCRRLANDAGYLAEEPIARSFDLFHGPPVQAGPNPAGPFDPQVVQARADLERVVDIEDVLRLVISASLSVDQKLLCEEGHRVRDADRLRRVQSEIIFAQFNRPGMVQEQFDEP